MTELTEFEELISAMGDTERASLAVFGLRKELPLEIDWRGVVGAQRRVETEYLQIYDFLRMQNSKASPQ
jgi:hypothetical protein